MTRMLSLQLLGLVAAAAAPGIAAPLQSELVMGVYYPHERATAMAKRLGLSMDEAQEQILRRLARDHHVNLIWVVNVGTEELKKLCAIAEGYGIGVVAEARWMTHLRVHRLLSPAQIEAAGADAAKAFKGVETLRAWVLVDEPRAAEALQVEAMRQSIRRHDPTRPVLVVSMTGDTQAYAERTRLDFLCADIYHFGSRRDPNAPSNPAWSRATYRDASERLASMAFATGKVPWIMPQMFTEVWGPWWEDDEGNVVIEPNAYWHWRTPTPTECVWQTWQGLIAGNQAVVFYVLFPPQSSWKPGQETTGRRFHTPEQLKAMGVPIEAERVATGEPQGLLYSDGRSTPALGALGPVFAAVRRAWQEHGPWQLSHIPLAFCEAPAHGASFTLPRKPDQRLVLVVNDNVDVAQTAVVHLAGGVKGIRLLPEGKPLATTAGPRPEWVSVKVELAPGGGAMLLLDLPEAAAGELLFDERFELASVPAKVENLRRESGAAGFGMGWRHRMVVAGPEGKPGTGSLTYPVAQITGNPLKGAARWLSVEGSFPEKDSLAIVAAGDGDRAESLAAAKPGWPVVLPEWAKTVRIEIRGKAELTRVRAWSAEIPAGRQPE